MFWHSKATQVEALPPSLRRPRVLLGMVKGLARFVRRRTAGVPLAHDAVAAGFPSPADDYLEQRLDFNDLIVEDEAATFVVRIRGDSMKGAGLFDGDYAVINRAKTPTTGCIVLAILDGEFTIKRYFHRGRDILLKSENPDHTDIVVTEDRRFEVWGVLRRSIRTF